MRGQEISINDIINNTEYILEMWDSENSSTRVNYYVNFINNDNNIYRFKKTRETRAEIPFIEIDMNSDIVASTYKLYQIIPDNTGRISPMLRMSPITTRGARGADSSNHYGGIKRKSKSKSKTRKKRKQGNQIKTQRNKTKINQKIKRRKTKNN